MKSRIKDITIVLIITLAISLLVPFAIKEYFNFNSSTFETVYPNSEIDGYNGIINDVINNGFKLKDSAETSYTELNTDYSADNFNGLIEYEVNNQKVDFDTSSTSLIEDNVYYNEDNFAKEVYYNTSMFIDSQFLADNYVDYLYDEKYQLTDIGINGGSINYKYDTKGNIISQSLNGKLEHTYTYDENNYLIKDENKINDKTLTYTYDEKGNLINKNTPIHEIEYFNNEIVLTLNGETTRYRFGYEFNGNHYVDEITYSNGNKTTLTYLNDQVTSYNYNGEITTYILNSDLDPLGFSFKDVEYYYVKGATNNVYSINAKDGKPLCFYDLDAFGNFNTLENNNISKNNGYLLNDYYLDSINKVYLGKNEIMIPSLNAKFNLNNQNTKLSFLDNKITYNKENFIRSSLSGLKAIEGMVISNVIENLNSQNIDAVANVPTINSDNKINGSVDLFTLPYGTYTDKSENIFNGNQIYELAYNSLDDIDYYDIASSKLDNIQKVLYMGNNYEEANEVKLGSLKFNGQFVYLGYYVEYYSRGDGIINFNVENNDFSNYKMVMNLYDYDNKEYLNLTENTFDFEKEFKDAVSIIPGFNQEIYEVCTDYVESFEQFEGQVIQETTEYLDSSYIDSSNISHLGDTLDFFENIDLDNEMVVLSKKGGITVKSLPFYLSKKGQTKLLITTAGLVACTVVGILCVASGTGTIVVPMVVMAAKGALTAIAADSILSITISTVKYIKNSINGDSGDLSIIDMLNETMTEVVDRCTTTAFWGALGGAFRGFRQGKIIQRNKITLQQINELPSYLHYDCPEYYFQSQLTKYAIENSGMQSVEHYLISKHSPAILNCIIKKFAFREAWNYAKENF